MAKVWPNLDWQFPTVQDAQKSDSQVGYFDFYNSPNITL